MKTAIGVDLGGTKIRAARVDPEGVILAHKIVPTPVSADAALKAIDAVIAELDGPGVDAIGLGAPGRVDINTGTMLSGGYVNLAGAPLAQQLRAVGGRPLWLDNDATMALVAEARVGAARGAANVVLLTIGTGIGGAALIGGVVVRGAGNAGQFGHITVVLEGNTCACGRRGCLETTSSGRALAKLIGAAGLDAETSAASLLRGEVEQAAAVLQKWIAPLRAGIDSLVAAFDPDIVLLGGGLGAEAAEAVAREPGLSSWFQRPIAAARLGDRAGVIGAALAALERAA